MTWYLQKLGVKNGDPLIKVIQDLHWGRRNENVTKLYKKTLLKMVAAWSSGSEVKIPEALLKIIS